MEAVLGLLPLDLHTTELATQARQRTHANLTDRWDGIGNTKIGHRRKADSILDKIPNANLPSDQMTAKKLWTINDEVEEPDSHSTPTAPAWRLKVVQAMLHATANQSLLRRVCI